MLDYNKSYDVNSLFEYDADIIKSVCNFKRGEEVSLQDLRNLSSAIYFAIYKLEALQYSEKEEPLTEEEYHTVYYRWLDHTSGHSAPSAIYGDPLCKVLEKQPLESVEYLFSLGDGFKREKVYLITTILKSFGIDLGDGLIDRYKKKFAMFNPSEAYYLALKSIWGDIKKGSLNNDHNSSL